MCACVRSRVEDELEAHSLAKGCRMEWRGAEDRVALYIPFEDVGTYVGLLSDNAMRCGLFHLPRRRRHFLRTPPKNARRDAAAERFDLKKLLRETERLFSCSDRISTVSKTRADLCARMVCFWFFIC